MKINEEKLKKAIFNSGILATEEFCGMDQVIDQMPDDILEEYYKFYK